MQEEHRDHRLMTTETTPAPVRYRFSGHETFPLRFAWIPKGIQAVTADASVFNCEDALVRLGVGKNMVQSIRHWCEVLGLIRATNRAGAYEVTMLGRKLFSPRGWDPYLEDIGTLWLLHWCLASRPEGASTWHLAFTRWSPNAFSSDDLVRWLQTILPLGSRASPNSLKRDVEVFLRTYVPRRTERASTEDSFDCPLVELGLISEVESGVFRFARAPQTSLPDAIFQYSLIDYWRNFAPTQRSLSFETLLHGPASPGAVFKLDDNGLCDRLERLPARSSIGFDETAGLRQVLLRKELSSLDPLDALETYYEKR